MFWVFPFYISPFLTDNGLEFANRLLVFKKGDKFTKPTKINTKCQENQIEYRLTVPFTPKNNGRSERVNGMIKSNTILKYQFENLNEMNQDLANFLSYYNLYRKYGSLRKEINLKTPYQAIQNG